MTDQNRDDQNLHTRPAPGRQTDELDAAGKSLSDALRISFIVLEIIMIAMVIAFAASGFQTVGSDERALLFQFGKIRPVGEEGLLEPGLHWVFPYPIQEIVKIPVEKKVNMAVDSFWYFQNPEEQLPKGPKTGSYVEPTLKPERDGYCITRSEKQGEGSSPSAGSDYNIIHSKWEITYQIDRPEEFYRNVYVENPKSGEFYFDVMTRSITPLLRNMLEDAVVTTLVSYTIDDVLYEQMATVTEDVKKLLQANLDTIKSGIKVISIRLADSTWPRQVAGAFLQSISASQQSQKLESEARTYADNLLIEAASEAEREVAQAHAYRTKVVEKASADYLQKIRPEYLKRPQLVVQKIYLETIEDVFNNADEKFVVEPGEEVRILVNTDPKLKSKSEKPR